VISGPYGLAAWSSPAWRDSAMSWLDEQLAAAGRERTGEVEQTRLRPWATVLRAPTADGPVWLKAAGPGTAFEVGLYALLVRTVPDHVLTPIAADPARGWLLLPDGGPTLGERREESELVDALTRAVVQYGRLQRELEPRVDELLDLGLGDMRPATMPARFDEALEAVAAASERNGGSTGRDIHRQVAAMDGRVASWCERLDASPVPASIDHNDLHPWNILGGEGGHFRYYDWGDSVVAHPFAAMRLPLFFAQRALEATLEDARLLRVRDAYLEVFEDLAPREELVEWVVLAGHIGKIARVLTWERALQAARQQGEEPDDTWASAPGETLASLLEESYVAGG
jgi:hypothetical protein